MQLKATHTTHAIYVGDVAANKKCKKETHKKTSTSTSPDVLVLIAANFMFHQFTRQVCRLSSHLGSGVLLWPIPQGVPLLVMAEVKSLRRGSCQLGTLTGVGRDNSLGL